jgi:predicted dehydrogenase
MINVGIIGYGYWGPNLVRNFADYEGSNVVAVADIRPDRLAVAARRHPGIKTTTDYREIIRNPDIDAVAIATPVASHFDLAFKALKAGKHVLVEKPLASSSEQVSRIIDLSEARQRILMVDHTYVYTAGVRKIASLIDAGRIGSVYYYDSVRINLGLFQHDVNVLWDLAVHDLSILDHLLHQDPIAVTATGMNHFAGEVENIAYLTLFFEDSIIAHIHVNWLSPVKIRRTLIGGSQKMIVYDDLEGDAKIKVYDKGVSVDSSLDQQHQLRVNYRSGDMWSPQLDSTEALRLEVQEFCGAISAGRAPLTDGYSGLRVVRILEAASRSILNRGRLVKLTPSRDRQRLARELPAQRKLA